SRVLEPPAKASTLLLGRPVVHRVQVAPLSVERQIPSVVPAKQVRRALGLLRSKANARSAPVGPSERDQVSPASRDRQTALSVQASRKFALSWSMAISPPRLPAKEPFFVQCSPPSRDIFI